MALTFGSLFAGIGGFDLGLERAGMVPKWQVEIDPFCRQVLAKHWPAVKRYEDVRTVGDELERVDVICGGFPCQDISDAGQRTGLDGDRSGLWREYARLVRALRPRYVIVENVAALLVRGMGRVLGDLAESGYDAEWECIPAVAVGARQLRDRVFIVAAPASLDGPDCFAPWRNDEWRAVRGWLQDDSIRHCFDGTPWADEPGVDRVAYGIPKGLDRCCALGNAIVPDIVEVIGRRILEAEAATVTVDGDSNAA